VQGSAYADSFGAQWKTFARSQLDSDEFHDSGIRFDSELGWKECLRNKVIVEFGSGAGRFIDVASRRGAALCIGLDITDAVDAAQENLGDRANVLIVQGDILNPPIRSESCDYCYSIGVLHHMPDPEAGFEQLVKTAKVGGEVGVGLYENSLYERPQRNSLKVATTELLWALNAWRCEMFRTVTTRLPEPMLLAYCKTVIPVLHEVNKIPGLRYVRYLLPSTCYRDLPAICSMVDTHDTYATKIVHQYRARDAFQWFARRGLSEIALHNSRAGWVSLTAVKESEAVRRARMRFEEVPAPLGRTKGRTGAEGRSGPAWPEGNA
jgi:ubiquinone/menaquinone biosynthesis C-methylase UbiE